MTNNYSSSGFSLKTLLPFLSLAFGFNSSKTTTSYSTGGFSSNMNRGIGTAAATVGFLSLAILKFVADSNRLADENGSSNNDNDEAIHQLLNRSEVLFHVVKTFLRNMILRQRCKGKLEQDSSEEEDDNEEYNEPMIHKGSCHCRSVRFEVSNEYDGCFE